mgnify:CR=1 FL=1
MIRELIDEYLELYPEEAEELLAARKLAERAEMDEERIFDRKNSDGHFTASAFILCPGLSKILLLKHKSLELLLQPGGHIEKEDATPFAAALRELEEETGCLDLDKITISQFCQMTHWCHFVLIPMRFQKIPKRVS